MGLGHKDEREVKVKRTLNPIKRIKETIHLYDELLFAEAVKGNSEECSVPTTDRGEVMIDFIGMYQGDKVTFYYILQALPEKLPINFKDGMRRECRGDTKLTFITNLEPHKIDWSSPQMKSRLSAIAESTKELESSNVNSINLHDKIEDIARKRRIEQSLTYLSIADKERHRGLLKMSMLIVVTGTRGDDFDNSVKFIEEYAKNREIKLMRVLYDIPAVVDYFSPFSHRRSKRIDSLVSTHVLTDEILARFTTYNQGILGDEGIYFGTDVYSQFPVLKRVKPRVDTAENWLITAETGGGKSFAVKLLILQLLAKGYNGTVMDIEGFEYIPMASFLSRNSKVQIINMAEGSGKYFDPVEIAARTGIDDIDRDAQKMSLNFTLAILKVLVGKSYDENIWIDSVLNDAVSSVYNSAGVTDDPDTWTNSKGLTLFDMYNSVKSLRMAKRGDEYLQAVDLALAMLSKYFEPTGTRRGIFKERVHVSDIIESDLLICSFGMAGKSVSSVDEVQMALMQLSAAQLSHQRSIYSKAKGRYNFKLWEEFQRWGKFPDSDKTLGVALTGGRKLGDVNIIITNVIKELLDNDIMGILDNITSIMIGAIDNANTRERVCNQLSIPNLKPELDKISKNKRGKNGVETAFSHAFLCSLDKSIVSIVKIRLSAAMRDSDIFKTGVDLNGNV